MNTRLWLTILWGLLLLAVSESPALATYNPQTGRWLSRDPIGEAGSYLLVKAKKPLLRNELTAYTFVRNRPIDSTDAHGLAIWPWDDENEYDPDPQDSVDEGTTPGSIAGKKKCCPECKPYAKGTRAYMVHRVAVPGTAKPHAPWAGDHLHWWKVNQKGPPSCSCFWNKDKSAGKAWTDAQGVAHQDETEPIIPDGSVPTVPAGTLPVPPFPNLTP